MSHMVRIVLFVVCEGEMLQHRATARLTSSSFVDFYFITIIDTCQPYIACSAESDEGVRIRFD